MVRLINADELIEFIENRYDITWKDDYEGGIKDACTDILDKINKMQTINPELIGKGTCENCQYASLFDGGLIFCVRKKCFERVKLDYSCKYWKEEK